MTFVAQGKSKDYSGKSTIMDELGKGKEVELTFYDDNNKIVIINHLGEVSGCIPPNPRLIEEYQLLRDAISANKELVGKALYHSVFTYCVQVTI